VPIYDYVCASCHQKTEVIHGIEAPGPRFCPACGAEGTMRKAFAAPTVHFRGSGWAKKDRSSASRTRARTDAGPSTSREGGEGGEGGDGGKEAPKTGEGPAATPASSEGARTDKTTANKRPGRAAGSDEG
jgi:putative FmdB family regulatory protein